MTRFTLTLSIVVLAFVGFAPAPAVAQDGWTTLFNGSTLDGWNPIGNANWELADGAVQADSGSGFLVTSWLVYVKVFGNQDIGDRPLLLFGILLIFTGVQFGTLGLLAELQARTYRESQDKPTYAIREIID